jgi:V8-like Glu-specific endopeptidase
MKDFISLKKSLLVALVFFGFKANSQVSFGGEPFHWADKHVPAEVNFVQTAGINLPALEAEDAIVDQVKSAPYRFGVEFDVNYNLENSGNWTFFPNEDMAIWQLGVDCPSARTINFVFSQYHLVKGCELYLWAAERDEFLGKFNEKNNSSANVLGTTILHSDRAVIELHVPISRMHEVSLSLGQIVHGYRPVLLSHFDNDIEQRGPYGTSGNCENNVNCAVGADWQIEKRAVALILSGGSALCTGSLVNNTANDGTPYFLTANHCYSNTVGSWVFVFNHETAGCTGTTGPTNQTISGSVLRAKNAGSDFCLLELNSTPPANYNVQYAGWDASDANTVTNVVGIHHPAGDLKKISFENDPVSQGTWSGAQTWEVAQWDDGVTEGGSSGSPLFDQNHRIIGQLYGGLSACSGAVENGQGDSYGRFGISWNTGTTVDARLKEWLDPSNSGVLVLDGFPDGFVPLALDASASSINNFVASTCNPSLTPSVTLINQGSTDLSSVTIQYQWNNGSLQSFNWTGTLTQGQSAIVDLPTQDLSSGVNTLTVTLSSPNNGLDENLNNNSISATVTYINAGAAASLPYSNDFLDTAFPYSGWQLNNPDADITWVQTGVVNGGGVLKYDCYNNGTQGEIDEFTTAPVAINANSASLHFNLAHVQYNAQYSDTLKVAVATSCDGPWEVVYNLGGAELATATASTSEYLEPATGDWRAECVDLSNRFGQNLFVKFIAVNDYGNNIFVDDMSIVEMDCNGTTAIQNISEKPKVILFPNPTQTIAHLTIPAEMGSRCAVEIFNAVGQLVQKQSAIQSGVIELNVNSLMDGIYQVRVIGEHSVSTLSWVIKK